MLIVSLFSLKLLALNSYKLLPSLVKKFLLHLVLQFLCHVVCISSKNISKKPLLVLGNYNETHRQMR